MIEAIIFDWGRTLYDSERDSLFPEVAELVPRLAHSYRLAIVSLVTGDYAARSAARLAVLLDSGLGSCFAAVRFVPANKDVAYVETLADLGASPTATAIVDDRARGDCVGKSARGDDDLAAAWTLRRRTAGRHHWRADLYQRCDRRAGYALTAWIERSMRGV